MYLRGAHSDYFLGLLPEKAWLLGVGLAHVLTHIMQEGCRQLVMVFEIRPRQFDTGHQTVKTGAA